MLGDLRFAFRLLLKSPSFTVVAFCAIALGIGVNTTVFGLANALLWRPLPVGEPDRLVQVHSHDARNGRGPVSYPNFLDYARANSVFTGIAAYQLVPLGFSSAGETTNLTGLMVSGNYFSVLGVQAAFGRTFLPEEDAATGGVPVVVLSNRFWRKLGSDPGIVGSAVTLNGRNFTVIGVAPREFTGTDVGISPDVWVPIAMRHWVAPGAHDWYENRRALMLTLVARLRPGVTFAEAEAQMKTIGAQLQQEHADSNKGRTVGLAPLEEVKAQALSGPGNENGVRDVAVLLLASAGGILLIVAANVANLQLARATTRRREMAVRLALGAGRGRIIRQLLTESVLLALIGGLGGVVLAYWLGDVLLALVPASPVPLVLDPSPDVRVLGLAFLLALASGVIFGLAPAVQTARWDLTEGLRERGASGGGASGLSARNVFVVAQIALSLLLLIGSGLFLKSFHKAQAIHPGFRTEQLALLTFDLNLAGYDDTRALQTLREMLEHARRNPQVRGAAVGEWVPLGFGGIGRTVYVEGRDEDAELNRRLASVNAVSPGYLDTLGIPLLKGRKFTEHDAQKHSARVAIINETMARQLWPNEEAIGRRFNFYEMPPMEVVGIARDIKSITLNESAAPMVYVPMIEAPQGATTLFVHTVGDPRAALGEMRQLLRALDVRIPILYERTIAEHMSFALWPSWMGAVLLGTLGGLALLLASMGVYGVMAYSVHQRTRELGVRMALGAQPAEVLALVFRQGAVLAVIGLAIGLLAAFAATRAVGALLYGVSPNDPLVFAAVTSLLAIAALAACYFPARRALRIDPMAALRAE
jgi:predicted permease